MSGTSDLVQLRRTRKSDSGGTSARGAALRPETDPGPEAEGDRNAQHIPFQNRGARHAVLRGRAAGGAARPRPGTRAGHGRPRRRGRRAGRRSRAAPVPLRRADRSPSFRLAPGEHGFHIHETGSCEPDFSAAGDHFNPDGRGHGFASEEGPHAGDLPNIFVGADGSAEAHFFNSRITLDDGPSGLFDQDGAAFIVHEKPDSYQAEAGAGGRVACGAIIPAG